MPWDTMFSYGPYIFDEGDALYVVVDDGQCLGHVLESTGIVIRIFDKKHVSFDKTTSVLTNITSVLSNKHVSFDKNVFV